MAIETTGNRSIEQLFAQLAAAWRKNAAFVSSIHDMALDLAYQRIIGLGPEALPLILRELQARPDHWFWALRAISGEDPALTSDRFDDAVAAWLTWGKTRGYL